MQAVKNKDKISLFFKEDLLFKGDLAPFYEKLTHLATQKALYEKEVCEKANPMTKMAVIKDVPNYLYPEISRNHPRLRIKRIRTYPGYAINLLKYPDFEDYLKKKFNNKGRYKLRMGQNRLEKCFNISYKVYYGTIPKDRYDFLFSYLKKLLERRFLQKTEANYELQFWEEYHSTMYDLILNKKAFLIVIYDDEKPIAMSVNVIYDKTIFGNIASYDVDYAAFGLGSIHMVQLIKWALGNHFEYIDLLKGYAYLKKNWMNTVYEHERHVIYNTNSFASTINGLLTIMKVTVFYTLFRYFKKMNLHVPYHRYKAIMYKRSLKNKVRPTTEITINNNPFPLTQGQTEQVCINQDDFAFLRKPVYDFAYSVSEKAHQLIVARLLDVSDTYFVFGSEKYAEIKLIQ